MNNATRTHIRNLLWEYKTIQKQLRSLSTAVSNEIKFPHFSGAEKSWTANQIAFCNFFIKSVDEILAHASPDMKNIFESKYLNGFSAKENALVACETFLSESTIKRRDNEFLKQIADILGWI